MRFSAILTELFDFDRIECTVRTYIIAILKLRYSFTETLHCWAELCWIKVQFTTDHAFEKSYTKFERWLVQPGLNLGCSVANI